MLRVGYEVSFMILRHELGLNWRAKEFKFLWGNFRTLKCILKFYNYQNFIFSKKQTNKTSNNPNLKPKVYPRFLWWTTNMCCRQDSWGGRPSIGKEAFKLPCLSWKEIGDGEATSQVICVSHPMHGHLTILISIAGDGSEMLNMVSHLA